MTDPASRENHLDQAVAARRAREETWKKQGERSLGRNLSLIGALGWLVVIPALLGIGAGRWLDQRFSSGITFTAALVMIGVIFGGWLAWQRMTKE